MPRHLGNTEELLHYVFEMNRELETHQEEKEPLGDHSMFDVLKIAIPEIEKRIEMIKSCSSNQNEIKKQSVHIGNYAMMIFCKAREF